MTSRFEHFSVVITNVYRQWMKISAAELEKYEIRGQYAIFLVTLQRYSEGVTGEELADLCGREKIDVIRSMTILMRKGLVEKNPADNDVYTGVLKLTEEGDKLATVLREKISLAVDLSCKGVSARDRVIFFRTLEKMSNNMHLILERGLPSENISNKKGTDTMGNFVIFTDSGCDIKPEMLAEWGVPYKSLTFRFTDDNVEHSNEDMDTLTFYNRMRDGGIAKTAAVNVDEFADEFEEILKNGLDILYIGFSSGLSTTYNSARLAADQLRDKYPERKIITIDTLAASAGHGLLVYLAVEQKKKGATIDEVKAYVEDLIPRMGIWFTVDDLEYLKRGGRVSPTAAFVGNMLGIKPVLYMDDEGHLTPRMKVRGRRTAIATLAQKYAEMAVDHSNGTVFISHGDCIADAKLLASMLKDKHGVDVKVITDVGPVIGAHSGPGTLALFFVGTSR